MAKRFLLFCFISILFLFFYLPSARATQLTLEGPDMFTVDVYGWNNSGLWFQAEEDVTLISFIFNNQGQNDVLHLTDAEGAGMGNILETYNSPSGDTAHLANVTWDLIAGGDYCLVSARHNNGKYIDFITNTRVNDHLSAIGSTGNDAKWHSGWFSFTDITTLSDDAPPIPPNPVPEPSTFILFGIGLCGGLFGGALKKKFI